MLSEHHSMHWNILELKYAKFLLSYNMPNLFQTSMQLLLMKIVVYCIVYNMQFYFLFIIYLFIPLFIIFSDKSAIQLLL